MTNFVENQNPALSAAPLGGKPSARGCDGLTEVLTPGGWVNLDQLPHGVPVVQHHVDGTLEFVLPKAVERRAYDGEMIHLRMWGREFVYAPGQQVAGQIRGSRATRSTPEQWTWTTDVAEGFMSHPPSDRYFTRAGHVLGGRTLSQEEERMLRIAVAVQADGWRHAAFRELTYAITVTKERKRDRLVALGLKVTQQRKNGRPSFYTSIPHSWVAEWLDDDKQFRIEQIVGLSEFSLHGFTDEVPIWDGDSVRRAAWVQQTARKASIDAVQAAFALSGHSTVQRTKERNSTEIGITKRERRTVGRDGIESWSTPGDGWVYIVQVPSGRVLTRRDGCVLVTGA